MARLQSQTQRASAKRLYGSRSSRRLQSAVTRESLEPPRRSPRTASRQGVLLRYVVTVALLLASPFAREFEQRQSPTTSPAALLGADPARPNPPPVLEQRTFVAANGAETPAQQPRSNALQPFRSEIRSHPLDATRLPQPLRVASSPRAAKMRPAEFAPAPQFRWGRFALVQTLTLGVGGIGFQHYNNLFGHIGQSFKIGNDWNKDHALHFDELLHFQGSYRITQAVSSVYRWAGVAPRTADWVGVGTSALIMTSLEYVDGRRKNDEASYSDLTANFLGMGFALARARIGWLQDFDLRMSYRTLADPFSRKTVKRYDRITHWLTYDLNRHWRIPLHIGVGYSVVDAHKLSAKSQYYFGVGISPSAVIERFSPSAAKTLGWLDFYHFGNQVQLNHVPGSVTKARHRT